MLNIHSDSSINAMFVIANLLDCVLNLLVVSNIFITSLYGNLDLNVCVMLTLLATGLSLQMVFLPVRGPRTMQCNGDSVSCQCEDFAQWRLTLDIWRMNWADVSSGF